MRKTLFLSSLAAILVVAFTLSCGDDGAPACIDNDGDTYGQNCSAGPDCNDSDSTAYPGATEVCDNNLEACGGVADAGCNGDGDNYCTTTMNVVGSPAVCSGEIGGAYPGTPGTDCDDSDIDIYPGAAEYDDGVDDDCDGDNIELGLFDGDGDGYTNNYGSVSDPTPDCNDGDETAYPGATEVCDNDLEACGGVADAGCNGDGDNYCTTAMNVVGSPAVCPGENGSAYPGTPGTDCDDNIINVWSVCTDCVDSEGDDWGVGTTCDATEDCDDSDGSIYPDAPEICDNIDNQCPGDSGYGTVDEGFSGPCGPMTQIPVGCFDMGDHFDEGAGDELPVHNVCLSGFKMDMHEVTNAEYKACVDAGVCSAPGSSDSSTRASYYGNSTYDDYPVIYVDWNQATAYCSWVGKHLPTEAEWEYAARGGLSGKRYPWGDEISGSDANYQNSGDPWDNDTSPVEYYPANGYGLYDMAGNVWEWVNDWYQSDYYRVSPTDDPPGPTSGTSCVLRGGSWDRCTKCLRMSNREDGGPTGQSNDIGFRCAWD